MVHFLCLVLARDARCRSHLHHRVVSAMGLAVHFSDSDGSLGSGFKVGFGETKAHLRGWRLRRRDCVVGGDCFDALYRLFRTLSSLPV